MAVAEDPRFASSTTEWDFWLVTGEVERSVRHEAHQRGKERGLVMEPELPDAPGAASPRVGARLGGRSSTTRGGGWTTFRRASSTTRRSTTRVTTSAGTTATSSRRACWQMARGGRPRKTRRRDLAAFVQPAIGASRKSQWAPAVRGRWSGRSTSRATGACSAGAAATRSSSTWSGLTAGRRRERFALANLPRRSGSTRATIQDSGRAGRAACSPWSWIQVSC